MGKFATMWHSSTRDERVELLKRLTSIHFPIDINFANDSVENLDEIAFDAGFIGIAVTDIDSNGMHCIIPAIISPRFAEEYRKRDLRTKSNA
jgi:hypothetical protein